MGSAAGRGLGRPGAAQLGRGTGPVGRNPDAEPLHEAQLAADDRARHAGLDSGAHDRRSHLAHQFRRHQEGHRFYQGAGLFRGSLQGHEADLARLEPPASPADSAGRRPHGGVGIAAGGISAPGLGARYARLRPPGEQMQAEVSVCKMRSSCNLNRAAPPPPLAGEGWGEGVSTSDSQQEERALTRIASCDAMRPPPQAGEVKPTRSGMLRMWRVGLLSGLALTATPAHAFIAYVSNEKSNTVSVIETDTWTVTKTKGRSA